MNDLLGKIRTPSNRVAYPSTIERGGNAPVQYAPAPGMFPQPNVQMGYAGDAGQTQQIAFQQEAQRVNQHLQQIQRMQADFHAMHERSKSAVQRAERTGLKQQMEGCVGAIRNEMNTVRTLINALGQRRRDTVNTVPGCGPGTGYELNTRNIINSFDARLKQLNTDFMSMRNAVLQEEKEAIGRRVYVATGQTLQDRELEQLQASGGGDQLYQMVMQQRGQQEAAQVLAEVQENHASAQRIERSLLELLQMFHDMATLVEQQGKQIDVIQHQVQETAKNVEAGTVHVVQAAEHQKSARKKKLIIGGIIAVVLAIIIIVVVVLFRKNSSSNAPPQASGSSPRPAPTGRRLLMDSLLTDLLGA